MVTVGVMNDETDYMLWQYSMDEPDQIYFEYYDQINSGYNTIQECCIDNDGCHIVLNNKSMVHFYWNPPRHKDLEQFVVALYSIYQDHKDIIDDLR